MIAEFKSRLQAEQKALRHAYESGGGPKAMLSGRTRLVDRLLADLWRNTEMPPELALVAVGGYGRGELYPYSDVDLLILLPAEPSPEDEAGLSSLVAAMWDIGIEPGAINHN